MELGEDGSVYKSILVRGCGLGGGGERMVLCGIIILGLNPNGRVIVVFFFFVTVVLILTVLFKPLLAAAPKLLVAC